MTSGGSSPHDSADYGEVSEDRTAGHPRTSVSLDSLDSAGALTYHDETKTYRTEYDQRVDAPQEVVVHSVAALEERSPIELDPLYTVIDPDALDQLFAPMINGRHVGDGKITFGYQGYEITLHSYGVVAIRPVERPRGQ
ncbi:hypothetical protein SAMN04488063_0597 [Halopelagius inordinatus]|uniref:Halobacterial output domain-containing protein n=1 Tax=Halopelagius inordinatus TaxID=553467 RepID=A0A1I2MCV7_9EURY|nr:HalOD1 output domain-containing protein [Halopelagius inordinatus]SFF87061.1 hypothetical protein SAMN04488063_0597 [Halopelagius inordinatus]